MTVSSIWALASENHATNPRSHELLRCYTTAFARPPHLAEKQSGHVFVGTGIHQHARDLNLTSKRCPRQRSGAVVVGQLKLHHMPPSKQ